MTHFGKGNLIKNNKAIRDKIPEIIKESGSSCNVKTLSDDDFLLELEKKLTEELDEYLENKSVEELADMTEIINRILSLKGISSNDFEKIKHQKFTKNGGFEKNLFLIDTTKP